MVAAAPAIENLTLNITQEIHVRSSITATFAALLEQMGPANEGHNGSPMPMTLEAWPGRRWFRDQGNCRRQAKARTLGELALHIANVPGAVAALVATSPIQAPQFTDPSPTKAAELIPALDASISRAKSILGGMDDATLLATWRMMK